MIHDAAVASNINPSSIQAVFRLGTNQNKRRPLKIQTTTPELKQNIQQLMAHLQHTYNDNTMFARHDLTSQQLQQRRDRFEGQRTNLGPNNYQF
jgi:hypothetical protein